ncbi:hypothetical protein L2E82_50153 [Cichorium intybus]|nr:hypothetical protein L2E82_50153 [Cichorium intybus]
MNLENNQFSGSLPELKIPNLEQFKESFIGNSLCGSPLDEICPTKENVPPAVSVYLDRNRKKKNHLSGGAIAGIVIGSVLGLVVLLLLLFIPCRKRTRNPLIRWDFYDGKDRWASGSESDDDPKSDDAKETYATGQESNETQELSNRTKKCR